MDQVVEEEAAANLVIQVIQVGQLVLYLHLNSTVFLSPQVVLIQ
jgi:hypothetical protein